ncbi:adenosine nucleotide alpha-hydrolase superfamily protein [Syntrophotalea carbinolica DSM 2380]|uniref:Adenosine nucleotide alpha-hydrolase superfamily protein n=1 Tax=Syntrophotalea carbinolica (strain DSM 2380 / NBRC 103641 / GraBd1) TaxID=338963 RepID=Q3A1T7_SYNC1|nr:ATP-dependent sacrificial sulfur transferase LarE [Syntrophotalea carbinolica]ABA89670.1 adenosine nucleotide alpha-hydrolase superfamily protein [Syntrophotalea carbinolica DSM 2380]
MPPDARYAKLLELLKNLGTAAVAFSGGVDSTLLLHAALEALGSDNVLAITVTSPFFPAWEQRDSQRFARQMGACQILVPCDLLSLPEVVRNDALRCYHCKKALFGLCLKTARQQGFNLMLDGTNLDDEDDYRPGHKAALELGVRSPLAEVGLNKEDIRRLSRHYDLPTWNRPAFACLASRIPYGTRIEASRLAQIETCETALRSLGFDGARARHHGDTVRIEIDPALFPALLDPTTRLTIIERAKAASFAYVSLDLEGYRTGSLNETLRRPDP